MKRATLTAVALCMLATSCGLKVPVSLVQGANEAGPGGPVAQATSSTGVLGGPNATSTLPGLPGAPGAKQTTGPGIVQTSAMFPNETEGVTKDSIKICGHVPITGAAPIPHDKSRFGQFYMDYVNSELGGVFGRKVSLTVYDDGYYPAGARQAIDNCHRDGAFIYYGAAGTDQIVSVAKWAEQNKVPYLHGPTSQKDLGGLKYSISLGPGYEFQSRLLADYLVKKFGTTVKYGMIRINSPYFQSGHDAFIDQLSKHGVTIDPRDDKVVQKDEKQFGNIFVDFQADNVQIINNMTTPTLWLTMLNQKPNTYNPTFSAISPIAGFNIVAAALKSSNSKAFVFSSFNPACNCTYYNTDLDAGAPWHDDEKEFLRIFKKYSHEQDPPPDDFDYSAYLGAKGFVRILKALGPNPTRTALFNLLKGYTETTATSFPSCPLEFKRSVDSLVGGWRVNVFELNSGKWRQTETCTDKP